MVCVLEVAQPDVLHGYSDAQPTQGDTTKWGVRVQDGAPGPY